jgi:hypothetical protein
LAAGRAVARPASLSISAWHLNLAPESGSSTGSYGSTGSYDDADDLVFAVAPAAPQCTVDADCNNGDYCDGVETCNAGTCQAGTAVVCSDGLWCNGTETCNETTDSCDAGTAPVCDDGLFCTGTESCNEGTDSCDSTGDPCAGGETCMEATDTCEVVSCTDTVNDDFEAGAPAWNNDAASTCTTGAYVTGNPTNAASGYQMSGSRSGTTSIFSATNSSAGVDDIDGGNCILGSPSYAVDGDSTLSVWYWFGQRDAGDDASGDFNILEYSTDDGATWTTMASNGDSTINPVWTNATAQIPGGSTVQLRMQCSDGAGPGDLVECGIDDFSILCN